MSIAAYTWDRRLVVGALTSRAIQPRRGIAAGSPHATFELMLLFLDVIKDHKELHPRVGLSVHVDDWTQMVQGEVEKEVSEVMAKSAKHLHKKLQELGMPLAEDKSQITATSEGLITQVQKCLGALAGKAEESIRRLGVDHALSKKGRCLNNVRKKRMRNAKHRLKHVKQFRKHGPCSKIYYAGVQPAALYGIELYEPTKETLRELTAGAHMVGASRPTGVPRGLAMMQHASTGHPEFHAHAAPILRFAREVWIRVTSKHEEVDTPEDALQPIELLRATKLIQKYRDKPRTCQQGPTRAIAAGLKYFGWKLTNPTTMENEDGIQLCIDVGSPAMLRNFLLRTYEKQQREKLRYT